ncbi:MAG: hypothetical protein EAZ76_06940 [Nostocales cyanobacterium]|nr:MAG: hypothetical protein EAZ87_12285 [Nostocales cyanobacterium]TAF16712.1 MAG: hypothetical protein EAZ76_06940 [Nostocales cyanobacterium]
MKFKIINYTLSASLLLGGLVLNTPVLANQAETPVKSIWSVFSSAEGGFRILMPGEPQFTKQQVKTKTGEVDVNLFSVERKGEGTKYTVAYIDYPQEYIDLLSKRNLVAQAIDTGKKTALDKAKGSIISEEKITLDGYEGKEVNYTKPGDIVVKHRIFLVGTRLYQVTAETTKEKQKFLTKSISGFCDSFKLLPRSEQ